MEEVEFSFGPWQVEPAANRLRQGGRVKPLEPKAMAVLILLCRTPGEVVSTDTILDQIWPALDAGDNPLHKVINQLRRALGDSAAQPEFIETIRRRGYRTVAPVQPLHQPRVQSHWQQGSPFPGLQPFSSQYAGVFFGRSHALTALLERVVRQVRYGRACCLIIGPSGCGKSSLLQAGVLPSLYRDNGWEGIKLLCHSGVDFADVSAGQLFLTLASAMLDWELAGEPVFKGENATDLAYRLCHQPEAVMAWLKKQLPRTEVNLPRFGLIVDRLEVLLTSPLHSNDERTLFIALLEQLSASGAVLVLGACRNDFYPQLVAYPCFAQGRARSALFDLAPPSRGEIRQMICQPAKAAGLTWQQDTASGLTLDELLLDEAAGNPDALPMLQYTLQALYLGRQGQELQLSRYRALGGLEGAIGQAAETCLAGLPPAACDALPDILSRLVCLQADGESLTSRSGYFAALTDDAQHGLVQALVEQRLFVAHLFQGQPCFSIAHEALLRCWPRAVAWIAEHKHSLAAQAKLAAQTRQWLAEQRARAYLLPPGKPLEEARSLANNPLFRLSDDERALLQASERRLQLKRWSQRGIASVLAVLALVSVVSGVQSMAAERRATEKRLAAENLLGFMVGEFADKLRGIGRMDLLDGISNKALEYFTRPDWDDGVGFAAKFQHGQTLEAIGEVAYSRGNYDEAQAALGSAYQRLQALLSQQPQHLGLLKTLGANAFWQGQLAYDAKDWRGAGQWFEAYRDYSEQMLVAAPDSLDAAMELSYALNSLGSLAMEQQDFAKASQMFHQALNRKQQIAASRPGDLNAINAVLNSQSWLASARLAQGQLAEGIRNHREIVAMAEPHRQSAHPKILEQQALSQDHLSRLLFLRGDIIQAWEVGLASVRLSQQLLGLDLDNRAWRRNRQRAALHLSLMLASSAQILSEQGVSMELQQIFSPDNMLQQLLAKETDDLDYRVSIVLAYLYSGLNFQRQENPAAARVALQAADHRLQQLPVEHKEVQFIGAILRLLQSNLTGGAAAKGLCHQALTMIQGQGRDDFSPAFFVPLRDALRCTGQRLPSSLDKIYPNNKISFTYLIGK